MRTDFSRRAYAGLLMQAKDLGYEIRPMQDAFAPADAPVLLLRHDVDLSLRLALQMAELENQFGLSSTYYILPHSDFYSAYSPEGRRLLTELVSLGHEVGLHWDSNVYSTDSARFREGLRRDLETMAEIIGRKIRSASQHNPIDSRFVNISDMIEIEAYSARVREKFVYVSDSSMAWRQQTPWDLLPQRRDMQFLSHPIWWMTDGQTREEKIAELTDLGSQEIRSRNASFLAYLNQCLADRDRLDASLVDRWETMP